MIIFHFCLSSEKVMISLTINFVVSDHSLSLGPECLTVFDCTSSEGSRIVRKPDFCLCENKGADQLHSNSDFVFATRIVQFLFFLNPKFQASYHFLRLHRPVYVGPGRKPRRPVFSRHGSRVGNRVLTLGSIPVWDFLI